MSAAVRFTAEGGPEVERAAAALVDRCARAIAGVLPASLIRALILIGGYGRGEGGVVRDANGERLHNNLDFLLIVPALARPLTGRIHRRAAAALAPLAAAHGVGLDLGVIDELTLRRAPARVMWVDMRHGHRTLLGDPRLVPSLGRFAITALDPDDVLALVVNRGTLLLINRLLGDAPERARVVRRHAAKGILGYGDAALWARGQYHPSYRERRERMARAGVSGSLPALYELAMAYRFRPDDGPAAETLRAAAPTLLGELEPIHRAVVAHRHRRAEVDWCELARAARLTGRHAAARVLRHGPGSDTPLAALFPLVAYPQAGERGRALAAERLGVAPEPAALARAYLRRWAREGDPNFPAAARAMGLSLEEP